MADVLSEVFLRCYDGWRDFGFVIGSPVGVAGDSFVLGLVVAECPFEEVVDDFVCFVHGSFTYLGCFGSDLLCEESDGTMG